MRGLSLNRAGGTKPFAFYCLIIFTAMFPAAEACANSDIESARMVGQYVNIVLGVALTAIWGMECIFRGVRVAPLTALLFVYTSWTGLTLCWTPDVQAGVKQAGSLVMCVLFAWIVADVCDQPRKIKLLGYAYVTGTLLLSVTAAGNIINEETYNTLFGRFSAIGTDPNNFGVMLCVVIPWIVLFMRESRKGFAKAAGAAALIYIGFLITSTASRGAIICALVLAVIYITSYLRRGASTVKVLVVMALAGCVVFGVVEWLPEQSVSRLDRATAGGEGLDRLDIWRWGIEYGFRGVFTGHGAGSFYYLNGFNQAHNVLVLTFLELGIIGVLLILAVWIGHFGCLGPGSAAGSARNLRECLLYTFMCVIAGSMFLNWETRKAVFLVYGMLQAYSVIHRSGHPSFSRLRVPVGNQ